MKCSGNIGNVPVIKWLNFGGYRDHRLDTGIVFRIRHCWEIRKVVSDILVIKIILVLVLVSFQSNHFYFI